MIGPAQLPLLLAGALLVGACAGLGWGGDLRHGALPGALVLYFVAAAGQLGALAWWARRQARGERTGRAELWILLGVALAARLCLLPATPSLSDDAWRYRWEGRVQAAGANPYLQAPSDPALRPLRDDEWLRVNHPQIPAIYGPPLQLLFRALAALPLRGLGPFKLAFLLADLALLAAIAAALRRRGADLGWLLVYAWHPLVLLEVAGQGHLEVLPVALLFAAWGCEELGWRRRAALAFGLALASKYLPLLALPALLALRPSWRERARALAWVLLPGALCLLPFLNAGAGLGTALGSYGATWSFNGGGFALLDELCRASGLSQAFCRGVLPHLIEVPPGVDPGQHQTWLRILPKLLVGLATAAWVALLTWQARRAAADAKADPRARSRAFGLACAGAGLAFLLGSPTVHPWYALWLLPWLALPALGPARLRRAALLWTLLLPLAYEIQQRYSGLPASWTESGWIRAAVWLPPLALALAPRLPSASTQPSPAEAPASQAQTSPPGRPGLD